MNGLAEASTFCVRRRALPATDILPLRTLILYKYGLLRSIPIRQISFYHPHILLNLALSLYAPRDTWKAHQLFGATCGPCALAAAIRRDVCELREAFPTFPEKQFTNLTMMAQAIRSLGLQGRRTIEWPTNGLALISGPERYHSRHWLAVHQDFVYEVSLETWLPRLLWERDFLPELAVRHNSRPEEWGLEAGIEISAAGHPEFPFIDSRGDAGNECFSNGYRNRQPFTEPFFAGINVRL